MSVTLHTITLDKLNFLCFSKDPDKRMAVATLLAWPNK